MTTLNLVYVSTPSHGYLRVAPYMLGQVGFIPSGYSFVRLGDWWLEEDEDAPQFMAAAKAQGITVNVRETNQEVNVDRYRALSSLDAERRGL